MRRLRFDLRGAARRSVKDLANMFGKALRWSRKRVKWLCTSTCLPKKALQRILECITVLGVVATAIGVWLTYQSLRKHDVEITFYEPADSQYVAGRIEVRGSVVGWPRDRVVIELVDSAETWESFPFVLDTTQLSESEHRLLCRVYHSGVVVKEKSLRFLVRNAPPTVSILHPQDGDVVSGEIEIDVKTDEAATDVQIFLNGERPLGRSRLNTLGLPDGHYTLTVVGVGPSALSRTDSSGFIVDNTPPRIKSLGLEKSTPVSGTLTVHPEIEEENVSSVAWYVDEDHIGNDLPLVLDTKDWPDGEHSIRLMVRDKIGRETIMGGNFRIDNTQPVVLWSLPAHLGAAIPRSASLFIDATAQDESGIAEVAHYVNGRLIEPGWLALSQFDLGATVEIKTVVRDRAGNEAKLTKTVAIQQADEGTFWDLISPTLDALGFQRQKYGAGPRLGTSLRQSLPICSDLDDAQTQCANTPILWVECDISPLLPLVFSAPLTLNGAGIGVYINPHFLEDSLLPTRLIFDAGGVTDISVLDRSDGQTRVLWYSFGWIGASVEVQLDYASWLTGQFRMGIALLLLKAIEGYVMEADRDESSGPGLPEPPEDRISERLEVWPYLTWWSLSLKIPLF